VTLRKGAAKFQGGGGVPAYYSRGGVSVPPETEQQARARRVREFERRFGSVHA
jgi:hypothetical protein